MTGAAKRILLEIVGWGLLLVGVAALVLPGPGLILMALGLAVLSQQYEWAERRLEPVKLRALKAAAEGVATVPRVVASAFGALFLIGCGVLWISDPAPPSWWPWSDFWWLPGGMWTGITQIASGLLALVLLAYSYRRFHGRPEAVAELEHEIEEADEAAGWEHDDR